MFKRIISIIFLLIILIINMVMIGGAADYYFSYTPHINLTKPVLGTPGQLWADALNANWDKVDARINQYLLTTSNVMFGGLTITGKSGVLKGVAGVIYDNSTTTDLPEGNALYYTDTRARASLSATTPLIYNLNTGAFTLDTVPVNKGGTNLTAIGTANQIIGTNTTPDGLEYKSIVGTNNRISVTHTANTVTLSGPQDISSTSTPTFANIDLTTITDNYIPYVGVGGFITSPISVSTNHLDFGTSGIGVIVPTADNILIDATTNPRTMTQGVFRINHKAGISGTRPISISIDANGYGDTHGQVFDYMATNYTDTKYSHIIDFNIDTSNATGGEIQAISVHKIGTGTLSVAALETYEGVNVINQEIGASIAADTAFIYDTGYTDVTTDFSSAGTNRQIFIADNNYIYLGNANLFNQIDVSLTIQSSNSIQPIFQYSIGSGSWTTFNPGDATNGFQGNGTITWSNLVGWATDAVNAVGGKYWVRIQRTRNTLATPPTESTIKIKATTKYGWNSNADAVLKSLITTESVTLNTTGTRPTCDSTIRGKLWHEFGGNGVGDKFEICLKGTADTYTWQVVFTAP